MNIYRVNPLPVSDDIHRLAGGGGWESREMEGGGCPVAGRKYSRPPSLLAMPPGTKNPLFPTKSEGQKPDPGIPGMAVMSSGLSGTDAWNFGVTTVHFPVFFRACLGRKLICVAGVSAADFFLMPLKVS